MNDMLLMQLLSIATAGLAILLNAGLVVVASFTCGTQMPPPPTVWLPLAP